MKNTDYHFDEYLNRTNVKPRSKRSALAALTLGVTLFSWAGSCRKDYGLNHQHPYIKTEKQVRKDSQEYEREHLK